MPGRLAQLVQSTCLTSRGSGVQIPQRPFHFSIARGLRQIGHGPICGSLPNFNTTRPSVCVFFSTVSFTITVNVKTFPSTSQLNCRPAERFEEVNCTARASVKATMNWLNDVGGSCREPGERQRRTTALIALIIRLYKHAARQAALS